MRTLATGKPGLAEIQERELAQEGRGLSAEPASTDPRADILGGIGWMALGLAVLVGSWTMDRLESQDVSIYTVPGLVPGLLGVAMMAFATLMLIRGRRGGGLGAAREAPRERTDYRRLLTVLALCIGFAVALVGRGLPFWLAAAIFVTVSIVALQLREMREEDRLWRGLATAATIGLGSGIVVTLVFEQLFLVRLP